MPNQFAKLTKLCPTCGSRLQVNDNHRRACRRCKREY